MGHKQQHSKFKPGVVIAMWVAGFLVLFGAGVFVKSMGWLEHREAPISSAPPPKTELPTFVAPTAAKPAADIKIDLPSLGAGCADQPSMRFMGYAWNSQMGLMFALGGPQASVNSIMCRRGVNLSFERLDDNDKLADKMIAFATAWKKGEDNPTAGTHFLAIMGDGAAVFLAGLNPKLQRICGPDCTAKIVGSAGRSLGEDKFMGPAQWKDRPETARGAYIAGVCKDGDWNIARKWAIDNAICNNPDDKVYDPSCLNWKCTSGYIEAATAYINGECADLKLRGSAETKRVCVNGVVTWTPGDVDVAHKKGGLISIVSTREYAAQMPNAIIGFSPWMKKHPTLVQEMLAAIFEGSTAIRQSDAALNKAAQVSDIVYKEENTGADYWKKYYFGVDERDKQGLPIRLGGSMVHDLADNVALFGLKPGFANQFEATYTVFGEIVKHDYPKDVPSYPTFAEASDTAYLQALIAKAGNVAAKVETPSYADIAGAATKSEVGHRSWSITFDTGAASFKPAAMPVLRELMQGLIVAGNTAIEIHGHTDNTGDPAGNLQLSRQRADAVKRWLQAQGAQNFPDARMRVLAHGQDVPVTSNASEAGRSQNRRVEIVLLSK